MTRMRGFLVTTIFLLLLAGTTACRRATVDDLLMEALRLAKQGTQNDWQECLRNLDRCIMTGTTDRTVVNFYLLALYHTGNAERAQKIVVQRQASEQTDFLRHYLAGKMCLDNNDFDLAARHFQNCRALRPDHQDTKILLAQAATHCDPVIAEEVYQELAHSQAFRNSFLAYNGLAIACARQGKTEYAVSYCSKALQLSGGHPLMHFNMALLNDHYLRNAETAVGYYINFLAAAGAKYPQETAAAKTRLQQIARSR